MRGEGLPPAIPRFRGGLAFKAHRLLYHSILGLRVIRKKKKVTPRGTPGSSSYLRLIDSCITQLKAQGPFRTCNESTEEEEEGLPPEEREGDVSERVEQEEEELQTWFSIQGSGFRV